MITKEQAQTECFFRFRLMYKLNGLELADDTDIKQGLF